MQFLSFPSENNAGFHQLSTPQQQELAQLHRNLARLQEVHDPKTATAYFASAPKRGTPGSTDNG